MIEVKRLVKKFDKITALSGITINLASGINIITGPNGAGKSTFLRCVGGLYKPTAGTVTVNGRNPYSDAAARRNIALLTDNYALYDNLTVMQNLLFFGRFYKLGPEEIRKRSSRLLNELGARRFLDSKVYTLSRGTKQKIALCRTLLYEPGILLLDEPTAFLDPAASESMRSLFARMASEGKTVVFATQKVDEISRFNSRLIFISKGRIVNDTSTYRFYRSMAKGSIVEIRLANPLEGSVARRTPGFSSGNDAEPTLLKIKVNSYRDINKSLSYLSAKGAYVVGIDYIESMVKMFS